jgi:3-hydroxyacyl-CoA dehydrogenase/enoyl-CoA hydratase/3-hydroxybutyryl-CoA epimerase
MVDKGLLGRKSGKGFYEYKNGKPVRDTKKTYRGDTRLLQDRLILRLVNEAVACRREGIVEDADLVDAGVIFGTGFAPFRGGPLHYAENEGRDTMLETLKHLQERFGDRFAADKGW